MIFSILNRRNVDIDMTMMGLKSQISISSCKMKYVYDNITIIIQNKHDIIYKNTELTDVVDNYKEIDIVEIIVCLYKKFGFDKTMKQLNGIFSIILMDNDESVLYIAQGDVGSQPLYTLRPRIQGNDLMNGAKYIMPFIPIYAFSDDKIKIEKLCEELINDEFMNIRVKVYREMRHRQNTAYTYLVEKFVPNSHVCFRLPVFVSANWEVDSSIYTV
jgi:hypothetical protein